MINTEEVSVESHKNRNKIIVILVGSAVILLVIGLGLWYNNFRSKSGQNAAEIIPLAKDSDRDFLSDEDEKKYGTDPLKADTDQDGLEDGFEVMKGLDPKNPHSLSPTMLDAQALVVQNLNLVFPKTTTTTKQ